MAGMLGMLTAGRLRLWRRVGRALVPWRDLRGSDEQLRSAIRAAREVCVEESVVGGGEVLGLGLDAPKPRLPQKVGARILAKNGADRGLRKL